MTEIIATSNQNAAETLNETQHARHKLLNNDYTMKLYKCGLNKQAEKVLNCGSQIVFSLQENILSSEQRKRLKYADFCKDRFCSTCAWRRALNLSEQIQEALTNIKQQQEVEILMLTLTVPNPPTSELRKTIQRMNKAFNNLKRQKPFKRAVAGWFRALEILGSKTKDGEVHPHFHCLLIVSKSYFTSRDYIKRDDWLKMWKKAYKDESITQVDIRKIKPKNSNKSDIRSATKEVAKYTAKLTDLTKRSDSDFITILQQTARLRFYAAGGILKINLKKAEEDLINKKQNDPLWYEIAILIYSWIDGDYRLKEIKPPQSSSNTIETIE